MRLLTLFILLGFVACSNSDSSKDFDGFGDYDTAIYQDLTALPVGEKIKADIDTSDYLDEGKYLKEGDTYLLTWKMLEQFDLKDTLFPGESMTMPKPVFEDDLKALNGKKVKISGYYIIVPEADGDMPILSAYKNSACFFCGQAEVSSVMDIFETKKDRSFKIDDKVTVTGNLWLNDSDYFYLMYGIKNARIELTEKQ